MKSIIEIAKALTVGSDIFMDREKGKIEQVLGLSLTLEDFDRVTVSDKKEKVMKDVWVVVFEEYPDRYFFAGKAINDILDAAYEEWVDNNVDQNTVGVDLPIADFRAEYKNGNEKLKMRLKRVTTNSGNSYTSVVIL